MLNEVQLIATKR